jgi:hypothetical protein
VTAGGFGGAAGADVVLCGADGVAGVPPVQPSTSL